MQKVKSEFGTMSVYSNEERQATWVDASQDISVVGKGIPQYTPNDNLVYYIVSETETSREKYTCVVSVGGKKYSFKCNICNMDKKYNETVRKAYSTL